MISFVITRANSPGSATGACGPPKPPPVWMAAEVLSFGDLSRWLNNLDRRADRKAIAENYRLDEKSLRSFTHHITIIRNICAHHGRLWNRRFPPAVILPNSPQKLGDSFNRSTGRYIFNTLTFIVWFMERIAPGSKWKRRVVELVESCHQASPAAMGFPRNWRNRPIWTMPEDKE